MVTQRNDEDRPHGSATGPGGHEEGSAGPESEDLRHGHRGFDRRRGHHRHRHRERHRRKERVLHTRISEDLSDDIRRLAEDLRVPVSNLVRNVLEEVFSVVESVSDDVGELIEEVVDEAEAARDRIEHRMRHRRRRRGRSGAARDAETLEELRRDEEAETGAEGVRPAFPDVIGWQPLVLNRAAGCAGCRRALARGERAFVGLTETGVSRTTLCRDCAEAS